MDFHSLIAVAALLVGIPTCVLMGKRRWLLVSGVTTVLSALAEIVAPDAFLRHEFSEELITFAMPQLLRFVGCVRLANGMMLLWSRASGEERVQTAALFSQAFAFFPINSKAFVLFLQSVEHSSNPNRQMALVTTFLWMWGSGYHFLSSRNTGFHQLQHEADTHLSIDFLVTVMVGVFTIMFPIEAVKLVTNDPDEAAGLTFFSVTSLGILYIGNSFISNLAREFRHARDKKAQLFCRVLTNILVLLLILYHQRGKYWHLSLNGVACQLFLFTWTANAVLGTLSRDIKIKE